MAGYRASMRRPDFRPAFENYYRGGEQVIEQAALRATDRGSTKLKGEVRQAFAGARLGRLGNAIGSQSDLKKGQVYRLPGGGFSASGLVYARSRSDRTVGALESYTEGSNISPVRSRWLWVPTKEAPARIGRKRTTPALYIAAGSPLGKLITIRGVNGYPLLAVENVGVSAVGARGGRARTLTKSGRPRKGDRLKQLSVLFYAIPNTSRAARVDIDAFANRARGQLPALLSEELRKGGNRNVR